MTSGGAPQQRSEVCLDCRTALNKGERCDGGPRHRVTPLETPQGRERLLSAVWGPPNVRRRAVQLAKAGGGGAVVGGTIESCASGCDPCVLVEGAAEPAALLVVLAAIVGGVGLVYVVSKIVEYVRRRRNAPRPSGALHRPRRPGGPRHAGVVSLARGAATITSAGGRPVAAFGLELRSKRFMRSDVMLRDGAAAELTVRLDDGRVLQIPAGRVRIDGPWSSPNAHPLDPGALPGYLARIDPLRGSTGLEEPDPLPYDSARELHLLPGDRVEVLGPLEACVDPARPQEEGYRSGAPTVLRPIGLPWLRPAAGGGSPAVLST